MRYRTVALLLMMTIVLVPPCIAGQPQRPRTTQTRTRMRTWSPGDPLPGLSPDDLTRFFDGQDAFETEEEVDEGIGPVFNDVSCVACHDGPASGGGSDVLATRIGTNVNGPFDMLERLGGPTIQVQGIGDVGGGVTIGPEVVPPEATIVVHRRTNPIFGLGLVDAVPDAAFHQIAANQQAMAPGQAGRPNIVTNLRTGDPTVGRFGWKAQLGSLYDFAADAYKDEMGITVAGYTVPGLVDDQGNPIVQPFHRTADGRLVSEENPPQGDSTLLRFDPVPGPDDDDDEDLLRFADFMTMLAPPPRRPLLARRPRRGGPVRPDRLRRLPRPDPAHRPQPDPGPEQCDVSAVFGFPAARHGPSRRRPGGGKRTRTRDADRAAVGPEHVAVLSSRRPRRYDRGRHSQARRPGTPRRLAVLPAEPPRPRSTTGVSSVPLTESVSRQGW